MSSNPCHPGRGHGVLGGTQAQAGPEAGAERGRALQPVLERGGPAVPQGGIGLSWVNSA